MFRVKRGRRWERRPLSKDPQNVDVLSKASQSSTEGLTLVNGIVGGNGFCASVRQISNTAEMATLNDVNTSRRLIETIPEFKGPSLHPRLCPLGWSEPTRRVEGDQNPMERALTLSRCIGIGRGRADKSF
jgi:hypothetical protein